MTLWVSDWQSESDLASIRNSFDFSWNWYVPFRVAKRFTSEDLSNFSFYMFLFHVNFQCLFIFTMFHARRTIPFSFKYLSLFCPRPSQKTEPQVFVYFLLSNTHNMFRLTPWSHGIWFSTDKNYTEITRNWALLSLSLSGIERKWKQGKVSFKLHPLRGLRFVPLSLSSFVLEPLLVEKYSSSFHWSKDASFQLWLSTSQPL